MTVGTPLRRTIWQAFRESARRDPERRAVICDGEVVTYGELAELAGSLASGFLRLGIRKGDKVAFWIPNSVEFLAAALGATRIGAIVVPVNPRFRAEEAEYVLHQSDSIAVLLSDRIGSTDYIELLTRIEPQLHAASSDQTGARRLPFLEHAICLAPGYPGFHAWDEVVRLGSDHRTDESLTRLERDVSPNDVGIIQYTSGSTGFPKGVMLSHDNLVRNAWYVGESLVLEPDDVYMVPLPFFHVGGLVTGALSALVHGASLVTAGHFEAEEMLRLLEAHQCTVACGVETHYVMAMNHPDFHSYDLGSLKKCLTLGTGELIHRIRDQIGVESVCTLYGITEASPNVSMVRVGEPPEVSFRTMGRPQPGVEVRIVDPDTGSMMEPVSSGEICVRGWNVMKGYYKQPEETARTIDPDGWLRTGDLGVLDSRGYLTFLGRVKNIIRVGGENVSAEEIENYLTSHPKVKLAQVVGVPHPRLMEVCEAYAELREGEQASEEELVSYCREGLAGFKVPRKIRFTTSWPMTGSGKIQRFKLKEMAAADALAVEGVSGEEYQG